MIKNKFGDKVTARQYAKQCVWMYGASASNKWYHDNDYAALATHREVASVEREIDLQTRRVKKFLFGGES